MTQAMVDILCNECIGAAISVPESEYSNALDGLAGVCVGCELPGQFRVCGDTDGMVMFFPTEAT